MSGRPNIESVRQLKGQFYAYQEAQETINRLEQVIEQQRESIEEATAAKQSAVENIRRLMREMDVESPGNNGYESRLFALLKGLSILER
jgi:uncharacterized phage protein gp47/JayE